MIVKDAELVEVLAKSPDGSSVTHSMPNSNSNSNLDKATYVVIPPRHPSQPLHAMDEAVRLHLANQRCVILKGQHLDGPERFCREEIEAARGSLSQPVQWHGGSHSSQCP